MEEVMKKISLPLAVAMAVSVCSCAGTNGNKEKDASDTKDLQGASCKI